jgi:hypothetical protein
MGGWIEDTDWHTVIVTLLLLMFVIPFVFSVVR